MIVRRRCCRRGGDSMTTDDDYIGDTSKSTINICMEIRSKTVVAAPQQQPWWQQLLSSRKGGKAAETWAHTCVGRMIIWRWENHPLCRCDGGQWMIIPMALTADTMLPHFVTPITPSEGYSLVRVYIRQVTTTRQDQNTQHKDRGCTGEFFLKIILSKYFFVSSKL